MPANTALTICRIQCDTTSRGANANANAVDLNAQPNSSPLQVAIASSFRLDIAYGATVNGVFLVNDVSDFASFTCNLFKAGAPYNGVILAPTTAVINALPIGASWNYAANGAHASFLFTPLQLSIAAGLYQVFIEGIDKQGNTSPIGQAQINLYDAGLSLIPPAGVYYTAAQSDARYPIKRVAPIQFVVANGQMTATALVPGLGATDLLFAEAGAPIASYNRNINPANPAASAINIVTSVAGPLTINAIVFVNQ